MSEEKETAGTALTPDTLDTGDNNTASFEKASSDQTEESDQSEDKKEQQAPQGAPENYSEFSIPDGMTLDQDALNSFTPIARELNLTQDQAQKLVDMYTDRINAFQSAQMETVANVRKGWVEGIKTDNEIGGAAMAEKVGLAVKALDKFGTPELRRALEESGLGDHPEMVRVFYRIGKSMAEDTIEGGKGGAPVAKPRSAAQILYPDQEK